MLRELVHIYGPFSINSYGVMVAIGTLCFLWLANKHRLRMHYIPADAFVDVVIMGLILGTLGGRLLFIATEWHNFSHFTEFFALWEGGLSQLGAVLAISLGIPLYLFYRTIPLIPCLDVIGLYALLLQSIIRIGCFLAGCCYGKATTMPWGVLYPSDQHALCTPLHPTQLYSSLTLLVAFLILKECDRILVFKPGQLFALALIATGIERFVVDFFRGDQEFFAHATYAIFSIHQWIALGIIASATCAFFLLRRTRAYPTCL